MTFSIVGYRKWSVCILVVVLAFILCVVGKATGAEFATVASIAVGGFTAANAYAKKAQP